MIEPFSRPPTPLFSNTYAQLPLAQLLPQTQLHSHQLRTSTFRNPISPKTALHLTIQLQPTSIPLNRPKLYISTSSLTAIFTNPSHSNSIQPYTNPQPNTMYPSPHQWTIHPNHTPPPSMATQPPLSTTSTLPTQQTHIFVPSFQPYTFNVLTCAPLSSQLQISDSTDYRYRPEQFLTDIKTRTIYQLGPEPTNPHQKHIGTYFE